jgi:hypothetical protein
MKNSHALLAATLVLAGCAAMDKNQCQNASWYAIGLEDGGQGRTLDRLGQHRRACAEYGVQPDGERYAAGRNEGLKSYCTYDRGYRHGLAGDAYYGVCPEPAATEFGAGYRRGKDIHDMNKRLDDVNADIRQTRAALSERGVSPRARAQLAERLEDLSREAAQLEQQLERARSRR